MEEVNFYGYAGLSSAIVNIGLPGHWTAGISFINARFFWIGPNEPPFQPDVLLNLEKDFAIPSGGRLLVGAQTGAGIVPQGALLVNYSYLDVQWSDLPGQVDLGIGAYYGNAALAGRDTVGAHVNVEVPVGWGLRLEGDYLSGATSLGNATVRLLWPLAETRRLGFGVQFPTPHSGNDYSGMVGLYWH